MKLTKYLFAALLIASAGSSAMARQSSDDDAELLEARLAKAKAELAVADAALAARLARLPGARSTAPDPAPANNPASPDSVAVVQIPATSKYDPMRLKVAMQFPPNVKTIQQASQYLLETVNYKLALNPLSPEESKRILARPLLAQDKDGSLRTIEDGLLLISGDDTVLIIDRAHKLISFELQKKK